MARPLLASIFISGGINALRNAEGHAQAAAPLVDKTVAPQADALPEQVPTDPVTLVKVDAAVKIAGGALLAFGKLPRVASLLLLGSLVPTTVAGHPFWDEKDPEQRQAQLIHFLKNAGLAGGLLLAAADTEGKPSVAWRAKKAAHDAADQVQDTAGTVQRKTGKATEKATKAVESAFDSALSR
ncbi:DoxX family protein [Prauserella cavernicola]|uniref:DoxX family protein n=1 Tax=Prauserella cavernicola TaxID=2800127 RepID=UPI0027DE6D04|nr:DoxX family protein [Prauserella cavernicola]